jgi:hypothetical protein
MWSDTRSHFALIRVLEMPSSTTGQRPKRVGQTAYWSRPAIGFYGVKLPDCPQRETGGAYPKPQGVVDFESTCVTK